MSVWNAVLQASHSAFIDELNARYPNLKLGLGLPKRFENEWDPFPVRWALEVATPEGDGILSLSRSAIEGDHDDQALLSEWKKRAEREFLLRGVEAKFMENTPKRPTPRLLIVLPISLSLPKRERLDYLPGVGVY